MGIFHIDADITKASTLSKEFYLSEAWFLQSKDSIFAKSWQFVGNQSSIPNQGDATPVNVLPGYIDEPLVLLHNDGNTHCYSNVCTHRGMILLTETRQKLRNITCRYHGRCFGLNGKLKSMPGFEGVQNFPSESDDLTSIPLRSWGELLFVQLEKGFSFDEFFSPMMSQMSWFPIEKLVFQESLSQSFDVDAHWALYAENYLEGFHIPFVHGGLNAVIDFSTYSTEIHAYSNVQIALAKEGETAFDLPPSHPHYGKKVAAFYYWVFPNMMFNFYPWGLSLNVVEPQSVCKTRVRFLTYILDEKLYNKGAGSGLDTVELEDEWVVQMVQKGIRSRFYNQGRYSARYEQGTHHFHRLVAASMNG